MLVSPLPVLQEITSPAPGLKLRAEVLAGLRRPQKELPPKLFYDARGSELFERICELPEYYLTRTETAILRTHATEIAARLGPGCLLIEYGSGSSAKTRILLDALADPAGYVPVDISRSALLAAATALAADYPELTLLPVWADYSGAFTLPEAVRHAKRRVVFFPGSSIGNFHPDEAAAFLRRAAAVCGPHGHLLVGVDLDKDPAILDPAYDDAQGVTAAFNLNLLARLNRELGMDFRLEQFRHRAFYHRARGRVEMHLVSLVDQKVHLGDVEFAVALGETILTECSYKYTTQGFASLARHAGLVVQQAWTDPRGWFSVQLLAVPPGRWVV
jgi:dimethylhistidine N-methyltransferase